MALLRHTSKTLVIFTSHDNSDNVKYFIRHGLFQSETTDFLFSMNSSNLTLTLPDWPNIKMLTRANVGWDFGGWSAGLFASPSLFRTPHTQGKPWTPKYLYQNYDHYIFINGSCRGPFLPNWTQHYNVHWTDLFLQMLKGDVALAGSTIGYVEGNHARGRPHVQSYAFTMGRAGLYICINAGVFNLNIQPVTKVQAIIEREEKMSFAILAEGFNIKCLMSTYKNTDFRLVTQPVFNVHNPYSQAGYLGTNIHPYEVIFIKTSDWAKASSGLVSRYTAWTNSNVEGRTNAVRYILDLSLVWEIPGESLTPKDFDWRAYVCLNPDVFKMGAGFRTAVSHWLKIGVVEKRKYLLDKPFDEIFGWKEYLDLNPDLVKVGIRTADRALDHFLRHGYHEKRPGRKNLPKVIESDKNV